MNSGKWITVLITVGVMLLVGACAPISGRPLPTAPLPTPLPQPQVEVVATGLLNPIGLTALPDGSLLVAEEGTGARDDSAGVSLIMPDGRVGRLISGLHSGMDAGDLAGVPLVSLAPGGAKVYLSNFGAGHLWALPLTPQQQTAGFGLPEDPLGKDALDAEMMPLNNVRLTNPFDITYDPDGTPVVTDASGNGVARPNPDGTTRFIHRFAPLPDPSSDSDRVTIDPVPTGITRVGDEYYVTLTGGCPFPPGAGRLVAIDDQRNERVIAEGLNMPIDVAQGPDGTIWVVEFALFRPDASCFTGAGYQARTGRLSRLASDGTLTPVLDNLNFPGAVLPMADGSLYLTEVFPGRVLHITFGAAGNEVGSGTNTESRAETTTSSIIPESARQGWEVAADTSIDPDAYDELLAAVIAERGLQPYPGADQREGDTPLARLGQQLFFDPILSGDRNVACATCHHPSFAMADGRTLPIGSGGYGLGPERDFVDQLTLAPEASPVRRLAGQTDPATGTTLVANPFVGTFIPRNSQSVLNAALFPGQFWDSRVEGYAIPNAQASNDRAAQQAPVKTQERVVNDLGMTDVLAAQALFPVTSFHEMAGATFGQLPPQTIRRALIDRLRNIPGYVDEFRSIFDATADAPDETITPTRLVEALAAFERRFIFTSAPWDDYLAGNTEALTPQQKRGALLFYGQLKPQVDCAQCHSGDLLSDFAHYNLLVPQLGPGKGHGYTKREDWGRAGVTFNARNRYEFRTPSLRNVELTPPYFHDGSFATLAGVIRHHADIIGSASDYDPAAHDVPPALYSSLRSFDPAQQELTAAPALRDGLPLDEDDVADLVAFMHALTDPGAQDLTAFVPANVPSGLPLDPLPHATATGAAAMTQRVPPMSEGRAQKPSEADGAPDAETSSQPGMHFRDVAAEVGIDFRQGAFRTGLFADPAAAMGAGLCWIDYDRDGWLDLYLVNSHAEDEVSYWQNGPGIPRNALYRNVGGSFKSVGAATGTDLAMRGNGCVVADFDGDGWSDIYVTADGPNALLWNNGDGTFTEDAAGAGVDAPEWNSAAAVGDVNRDGLPDLFVAAYIDLENKVPKPSGAFPQDYYGLPDRLYLNAGPAGNSGRVAFRDVTAAAGLTRAERGLGALLTDLDQDGDLDLYIANDGQPNRLYVNQPVEQAGGNLDALTFRFTDVTRDAQVGDAGSGMGVAGGDYDGDGRVDLFITNWERELNALYRNTTAAPNAMAFEYSTFRIGLLGLGNGITGWGTAFADFDRDTDADLLFVNGRVPITNLATDPELVRLYRNRTVEMAAADGDRGYQGRPRQFVEATASAGLEEVGTMLARGSAVADYDNDGDLDVAINTIAGDAVLLMNETTAGNWLEVAFDGFAPGTRVSVQLPDGRTLLREAYAGSSYLASEDPRLHFGLGNAVSLPQVEVVWPNGKTSTLRDVAANQLLTVTPAP